MSGPEPGDQQDREFAQRSRERALEADEVAETAHPVGEFGTAQQRMEGAAQPAARPARHRVRDALLLGGHILVGQRRETRWHCHSSMAGGL
jgi:hypothetical protein